MFVPVQTFVKLSRDGKSCYVLNQNMFYVFCETFVLTFSCIFLGNFMQNKYFGNLGQPTGKSMGRSLLTTI